jgi:hypothetical protein
MVITLQHEPDLAPFSAGISISLRTKNGLASAALGANSATTQSKVEGA